VLHIVLQGSVVMGVINIDTLQLNKMPEHYSRQQMLISSSENILFSNSISSVLHAMNNL